MTNDEKTLDLSQARQEHDFGDTYLIPEVNLQMKKILPGSFYMGSNTGHYNEKPRHRVHLTNSFWMGIYPVTQAQYRFVKGKNPSMFAKNTDEHPVEKVNWNDCRDFCKILTQQEREAGNLSEDYEFRLPTEAEWEYVCRGGSDEDFISDIESMVWYFKNSNETTHPVGMKEPNNWGFFDMQGNVWEWVMDGCEFYECEHYDEGGTLLPTDRDDMVNPYHKGGTNRLAKGGCWLWDSKDSRPSARFINPPDSKYFVLGFRIVLGKAIQPSCIS